MNLDNLFGGKAKKSRKQNNYSLPGIIGLTTSRKTAGSSRRFSPIVDKVVFPSMIPKYPKFKERKNMPNQEFLKKTQGCWHYRFRDSDGDGVVNGLDCFPFDKKRHYWNFKKASEEKKYLTWMTPTEYLQKTGGYDYKGQPEWFMQKYDDEELKETRPIKELAQKIRSGTPINIPDYDEITGLQEGRHRAYAAQLAGQTVIPVAVNRPRTGEEKEIAKEFTEKLGFKSASYQREWEGRFQKGIPEVYMDKKSREAYNEIIQKRKMGYGPAAREIKSIRPAPVEKQQEWKEMPQDVKVAEQTIKTDTDGDSVPDEYDCNPENPKKQDSQLYLAKKNIKIGNLNIGEKKSKELTKDAIMFTIPQIYPNRTFIASGFKDVNFNRKENIDALSNVITHEELHHTLQHISPEASFELDNISVGSTEYKGMIMNPKTIATINPTIQKAIEKIHIHYPEKERNAKMIKIVDENHEELKEYWSKKDQHIPPAPVEKQQEWKEMPQDVKVAEQTIKTDTDHDNVPDEYDKQTKTEDEYDKHEKMKKEFYEDQDRVYGVK